MPLTTLGKPVRRAWIIASGTELALGQTVDTNSAWLATRCAALGIRAVRHITVSDELDAIRDAAMDAAANADVVLLTGGLGPTEDDLTRAALAAAAGVPLVEHAESLAQIQAFFVRRGRQMHAHNRVQAQLPHGAEPLENRNGTAPGFRVDIRGTPVIAMPGVPAELKLMFDTEVAPVLAAAAGGTTVLSRTVYTIGMPESELGARIADLMQRGRNPEVGTTADGGTIGVRINATAERPDAARRMLDEAEAEIRGRLGEIVYGRDGDTLAGAVGELLAAAGKTLAIAESCTGGLLGAMLTETPGSSRYFLGGIISYSNDVKHRVVGVPDDLLARHGAVSGPVAEALARGVAQLLRADYALAITGIAGPGGGTADKPVGLVYIGLLTPQRVSSCEVRCGPDASRALIRTRSARGALDLLRRTLLRTSDSEPT
jgi:nicotinamide-nucleotide amidase